MTMKLQFQNEVSFALQRFSIRLSDNLSVSLLGSRSNLVYD